MNITGGIFDLDGTLVDSMPWWDLIWIKIGSVHFGGRECRPDPDTEMKLHTVPLTEAAPILQAYYERTQGVRVEVEDLNHTICDDLMDFYKNRVPLKAGVAELLAHLYAKGVKMCVASASERDMIELVLEARGIKQYFSGIFTCSEIGKGKKFPDIYHAARAFLGTPTETTWVFEDAYDALHTAHSIGLSTVGIYEAQEPRQADMERESTQYIAKGEAVSRLIPLVK